MYTGYHVEEGIFDELKEKVIYDKDSSFTATDVGKINRELRKMKHTIHERIYQLERTIASFTVEDVLAQYIHKNTRQQFYL